jgi:hypothetical protein
MWAKRGASVPRSFLAYFLPLPNFNLSKPMTQPTMQETKIPGKTKMPALRVCEMERLSKLVGPMSTTCLYLSSDPYSSSGR